MLRDHGIACQAIVTAIASTNLGLATGGDHDGLADRPAVEAFEQLL